MFCTGESFIAPAMVSCYISWRRLVDKRLMGRNQDQSQRREQMLKRQRRFDAALGVVGLSESFRQLPRPFQELFWRLKLPDPVLLFDSTVPTGAEYRTMRRQVEKGLRTAVVEIDGKQLEVRDLLTVLGTCGLVVQSTKVTDGLPDSVVRFLQEAGPRLDQCHKEHFEEAIKALYYAVLTPLVAHSRLDEFVLTSRSERQTSKAGKFEFRVIVAAVAAQTQRVALDGKWRCAHRVGSAMPDGTVNWVSWNTTMLRQHGIQVSPERTELPVYVQGHALMQLERRANLPAAQKYLHAWLADSLAEPRIMWRHRNELIVEQRLKEHRVGYLVVTPLPDLAVVRTFKFLTMEGTPERRQLEKRLRVTRGDLDYLGLDRLASFTETDLRHDPKLRRLMEKCGCGHLFQLAESISDSSCAPTPTEFAARMRRYLRIAA